MASALSPLQYGASDYFLLGHALALRELLQRSLE